MELASAQVIGAGLAAIGVGAAAAGVGMVFGSFLQGALRNPSAAGGQTGTLYIGFADAWDAVEHLHQVLATEEWREARFSKKAAVT